MEPSLRSPAWQVTPAKDFAAFLRGLMNLVPETAILYIEGGGRPPKEVEDYLEAHRVDDTTRISTGTLLPRPRIYRVRTTQHHLEAIAVLSGRYPTPEGAIHLHVYQNGEILLTAFDAFLDPFWISMAIPEERVQGFCASLGLSYKKAETR